MSMNVGGAKGGITAEINVTPLVDIMLVLLIIMMLIAPMLQQGVQLELPVAGNTVDKPEVSEQTIVAVARDKTMYLNAKSVLEEDMAERIKEILESKSEKIVLLKADREVDYGAVMAAMDQLRKAGVEDIGLITDPKKAVPGGTGGQ